jgi:uncharacterized protein YndB with AHSA1/START domain
MLQMKNTGSTTVSKLIAASRREIYRVFVDADAITAWLPPGTMRGVMHRFEPHIGGAFSMSLIYAEQDIGHGKSDAATDTFDGRFAELVPDARVVWAVKFRSTDPAFGGEMRVITTLDDEAGGTRVTMACEGIPPGIRPEDNETGTRETLEKLAAYLARRSGTSATLSL